MSIGEDSEQSTLAAQSASVLSAGDRVRISANKDLSRFLILAGRPINEPIAQRGPFVMNTEQEIEQAVRDYHDGVLCD